MRWTGASALAVVVTTLEDVHATRVCTATLWEIPLPHAPPFAPGDDAAAPPLPPPFLVAAYADVFMGPSPELDDPDAFDKFHPMRAGVGPTLCTARAQLACIDAANGTIALRDLVSGETTRLRCLTALGPATALRSVILDQNAVGPRCMLVEMMGAADEGDETILLDAEADVVLRRWRLPRTQVPVMHTVRVASWCAPRGRCMMTAQVVPLPEEDPGCGTAAALRAAACDDGAACASDAAGEAAAAELAHSIARTPWVVPMTPSVVLYRLWDCAAGAPLFRAAAPALTAPDPLFDTHGAIVTSDAFDPAGGAAAVRTLFLQHGAADRHAHLALWDERGARVPLPAAAAIAPRVGEDFALHDGFQADATWRFAAVERAAWPGAHERTSILLLDFLQR